MRIAFAVVGYFVILSVGGSALTSSGCVDYRLFHPRRHRMLWASYLALAFTPSILSDFFLWSFPGPATLGLLLIGPTVFSDQWSAILMLVTMYYLLPLKNNWVHRILIYQDDGYPA